MKLHQATASVFIPDGVPEAEALARVTHLGIGAHQDDLEFMAFHGILNCFQKADRWFGGVTCTNGAGSARSGAYAGYTDEQMQAVRRREQEKAAVVGDYGVMVQLDYPSATIKTPGAGALEEDLVEILRATQPAVVYTHNPADKHDTHIAVTVPVVRALRALAPEARPKEVYGCEVWRGLDWMLDRDKVPLDVSGHANLAQALNGIFDSQIAGGKRYDLATIGRRRANATFFESHATDASDQLWFAMDLSPLVRDEELDIIEYVMAFVTRFANDVEEKLRKQCGGKR